MARAAKRRFGDAVAGFCRIWPEWLYPCGAVMPKGKPGLYANLNAKKKRGGKPRKPGSKGAPTAQAFRDAAKTAKKK